MTKAGETINWPVILLLENNEEGVFQFRRALSELCYPCHLHAVETLVAAHDCIENVSAYKKSNYFATPDLVVCSFEAAGNDVISFAQWLRGEPRFSDIPLVLLSWRDSPIEQPELARLKVTAWVRKTDDVVELGNRLRPVLPTLART